MKTILYSIAVLLATLCWSCYDDKGNYDYTPFDNIVIEGISEQYQVQSFLDTLAIDVKVMPENADYEYLWTINTAYQEMPSMGDGFLPDTISSDNSAHSFNLGVHVKNLPFIMSKYLALGMNLYDVIRCTTENAAKTFNQEGKIGTLQAGAYADIAILKLVNKKQVFADSENNEESTVIGQQILVPQMTVINGMVAYRSNEL